MSVLLQRWRETARGLKRSAHALYLAARHPGTPWYARALAALVAAYALSPIDLIPDPIPVLGYLDDLILVPAGIWLTLRLIPPAVWAECVSRAEASEREGRPVSRVAAAVIVGLWIVAAYLGYRLLRPFARAWFGA
jgi:uncharacterized membrane protein YkvA (DUF1232 family)